MQQKSRQLSVYLLAVDSLCIAAFRRHCTEFLRFVSYWLRGSQRDCFQSVLLSWFPKFTSQIRMMHF